MTHPDEDRAGAADGPALMALIEPKIRDLVFGLRMALDPDGFWRNDSIFAGGITVDNILSDPDPIQFFHMMGARERAAALAAVADWAELCPFPLVKAAGRLLVAALRALIEDGTPMEKTLGLSPDQGQTARHGVRLARRDGLLRQIAGLRVYAGLTPRQAARSIRDDFTLYLKDHDETRASRPQGERDGLFWALAKMRKTATHPGLETVMPDDVGHLARIIFSD